jgi:Zn-dependent protease with chaperone function
MRWTIALATASISLSIAAPGAPDSPSKTRIEGYAEYHQGNVLIVDGQRVVASETTRLELSGGRKPRDLMGIPLGYEVKVEGARRGDGAILASKVEAKPDGMAMFESDVVAATNQIERMWVRAGEVYDEGPNGRRRIVGEIIDDGPEVARVRSIMARLVPPYLNPRELRVRVVDTKEWNASAMGNGAIWVYRGLLRDLSDDEIAIILGHELAHYTYEHSRRSAKKAMWGQIAGLAGLVGAGTVGSGTGRDAATLGALLSVTAWQNGYSRDLEDQADRVGLRYAYEGGFDVSKAPGLWKKFRKKYGEESTAANFLFGSHSRPSDRIRNIERELRLNYPEALETYNSAR